MSWLIFSSISQDQTVILPQMSHKNFNSMKGRTAMNSLTKIIVISQCQIIKFSSFYQFAYHHNDNLSCIMRKPTFCISENKAQIRFPVTAKLISTFVFATRKVQFLSFLNPIFPSSSHLLRFFSSVCVRPGRKPHCWFSHDVAHISFSHWLCRVNHFKQLRTTHADKINLK